MHASRFCQDLIANAQAAAQAVVLGAAQQAARQVGDALAEAWPAFGDWSDSSRDLRQGSFVAEVDPAEFAAALGTGCALA